MAETHFLDPAPYEGAPSIVKEIGWVTQQAVDRCFGEQLGREFWLRKAAVLDRIAISEESPYAPGTSARAAETADLAARRLIEYDTANSPFEQGDSVSSPGEVRDYVRRQYRAWSRTELV